MPKHNSVKLFKILLPFIEKQMKEFEETSIKEEKLIFDLTKDKNKRITYGIQKYRKKNAKV